MIFSTKLLTRKLVRSFSAVTMHGSNDLGGKPFAKTHNMALDSNITPIFEQSITSATQKTTTTT